MGGRPEDEDAGGGDREDDVYDPAGLLRIRVPRLDRQGAIERLARAWEETREMDVPQYREGCTSVRQAWDEAVCEAVDEADRRKVGEWADRLNREPAVSVEGFYEQEGAKDAQV